MKKYLILFLLLTSTIIKADYWTQKADFPEIKRQRAFSFSIGSKGYVGCGQDSLNNLKQDFWEYDPLTNLWTQKADFSGAARIFGTGFSISNKGYAGLGSNGLGASASIYQDFWEYDPLTNSWTQKANFGGGAIYNAAGFSISNMGYIVTGFPSVNDFWQYDPINDLWSQKSVFPGALRSGANCFVIANNAYVMCGGYSSTLMSDVWEYNGILDSWSQKANFPDTRALGAAFSICDKGYFGTGLDNPPPFTQYANDFWQFDPFINTWIQKTNFPGINRESTIYFSIGTKGYIGLGYGWGYQGGIWEYTPDSTCITGIVEYTSGSLSLEMFPNPFAYFTTIKFERALKNGKLVIANGLGKEIKVLNNINETEIRLERGNISSGIYSFQLTEQNKRVASGEIIVQ